MAIYYQNHFAIMVCQLDEMVNKPCLKKDCIPVINSANIQNER